MGMHITIVDYKAEHICKCVQRHMLGQSRTYGIKPVIGSTDAVVSSIEENK